MPLVWSEKLLDMACATLRKHTNIDGAISELRTKTKLNISKNSLDKALSRNQLGSPAKHLKQGPLTNLRRLMRRPGQGSDEIQELRDQIDAKKQKREHEEKLQKALVLEDIERFSSRVFSGRVKPITHRLRPVSTKRINTAVLSDLHFGSDLLKSETGVLDFGIKEEARRLAFVTEQICEYKEEYRSESELELLLLGDLIHGGLHDERSGADLSEQINRAVHLLTQCVAQCAARYKAVRVRCATGNHGRNKQRHPGRATSGKYDSWETVIYHSIAQACSKLTNVKFHIPKTPYLVYEVFGKKVFCTHGDGVLSAGNPGKAIKTGSLENQLNRINATLRDTDEYAVAITGHVHVPSLTYLGNGVIMITNGALIPVDDFAVSLGLLESQCGQFIFESVPGYPVGDSRLIRVDSNVDKDARLDRVIVPWNDTKYLQP